jgi:glycosyltransferase involved in cell wall biosynthesis
MKIVHVSHLYHPSHGGVQYVFKNISERLVRDYGDDVTVVTTDSLYGPERKLYKKAGPYQEIINGVTVLRFPYQRWHIRPYWFLAKVCTKLSIKIPESFKLRAHGPLSPKMKKYLIHVEADAIFASSSNYYFMQLPLWRKCNFFYYGSIHLNEDETKAHLLKKQVDSINASTLYLANTSFEIERLVGMGVKREKIFVLGAGVDMELFLNIEHHLIKSFKDKLGVPDDGLLIGYVGRIEATKSVHLVIKAFEKICLENDKAYLLIAGSGGNYVEELKHYCSQLSPDINSRIKWQVNFKAEEKPIIFSCLDVFVLPSQNESFGLVFLEAWSCKKPVVGASIGAVRHVIQDGVDGLLMEINDHQSLASQLIKLLNDKALRTSMGENGFNKVRNNYTWDVIVARLRQCYINGVQQQNSAN